MSPGPAMVSLLAAATLLTLGGCGTAGSQPESPGPKPSASSSGTPADLAHAFADTKACHRTLPRLAEAIGPDLTTTYTDDYGSPVEGETYVDTDGSIQASRTSVGMSPEQYAAAEAILGPQPERYAPQSEVWHYATNTARTVAAGANDVRTACFLIMSSPSLRDVPGITSSTLSDPNAVPTTSEPAPVEGYEDPLDHQAGDDQIARRLPEPPAFWFEAVAMKRHTQACVAAMIDAVPRLVTGAAEAVEGDYASAPNLLWQIESVAESVKGDAPDGSASKVRGWLSSTDRFDYPRSVVTSQCLAYDGVAVG